MRAKFVPFPHTLPRARFWKMMEKALADVRRERYNPNARRYAGYTATPGACAGQTATKHHRGGEKLERSHKARVCGSPSWRTRTCSPRVRCHI